MGTGSTGLSLWLPALIIVLGLVGVVVPVLPGLIITVGGVLLWALMVGGPVAWVVFGVAVALYAAGLVLEYLLPARRMREAGVGGATLVLAVGLGVVGFFVVPVVGAPLGFVLGIYAVEQARTRDSVQAWSRTLVAVKAVAASMGIELGVGLLIAVTWVIGVVLTR